MIMSLDLNSSMISVSIQSKPCLKGMEKELLIDFAMKAEATEELATIIVQNIMKENYDFSLLIKMRDQNLDCVPIR